MTVKQWLRSLRFNSSRKYLLDFVREAAASLPEGALVLDAGAGDGPYKHLFSEARYESADFCQVDKAYGEITYVCNLTDIPVEDNRYDLILLTQVLEHLPEPQDILKEMLRILKPAGELWLSSPLFFAEHEVPYDSYRYTQFGLDHLLQSEGFALRRMEWLEGYYGTLSYQFGDAAVALPYHPKDYGGGFVGAIAAAIAPFVQPLFLLSMLFSRLDVREKHTTSGYCKNYAVAAVNEPVQ